MKHKKIFLPVINKKPLTVIHLQIVLTLCLLMSVSSHCIAQQTEGVIHYRVTDDGFKKMSSMEYYNMADYEKDKNRYSSYISTVFTDLYFNAQKTKYAEKQEDGTTLNAKDLFISLNFQNRSMTRVTPISEKHYIISDSLHAPKWSIMNDIKDIVGHICMSA